MLLTILADHLAISLQWKRKRKRRKKNQKSLMKTWDSVSLINLPSLFSNGNKNVKGLQTSVFVHIL